MGRSFSRGYSGFRFLRKRFAIRDARVKRFRVGDARARARGRYVRKSRVDVIRKQCESPPPAKYRRRGVGESAPS